MAEDISVIRYEELPPKNDFEQQRLTFTWGKRTKYVEGVLKLVQMIVKIILTTPGRDHFATQVGTIVPTLFQRGVSQSSVQLIKMDIMISLQDLERQIQDIQAGLAIPDSERLREIETRRVEYLTTSNEWIIELSVLSEAGQGVTFDIAPYLKGK